MRSLVSIINNQTEYKGDAMTNYKSEIYEQPVVYKKLIEEQQDHIVTLASHLRKKQPKSILLAARGTSDNAATYAKYLFSSIAGIPTGLAIPSLYTIYEQPPDIRDGLVVGISQSGRATDVLAVLKQARLKGVTTLAITNEENSPMAETAEFSININAGKEKAVAASKTYTGQLLAIALLTAGWIEDNRMLREIGHLPEWGQEALAQHPAVTKLARWIADTDRLVVLARGYNHCVSYETALKIKELAYISADAYSAADFRHGPVAMLEKDYPVIAVAPQDKSLDDMKDMINEVKKLDVRLGIISNNDDVLASSPHSIQLPKGMPGWLSPIIATMPGQLLALELALAKGLDVDNPRGLKKVTLTY